jgi:hypothetical protein
MLRAELADIIDLTIVRAPVFWEQDTRVPEQLSLWNYRSDAVLAKNGFWRGLRVSWPAVRADWTPQVKIRAQEPFESVHVELVSEERLASLQQPATLDVEARERNIPYAFTSLMDERSPQFSLRNLARVQRDIDLLVSMPFDVDPIPLEEAEEAFREVRTAHIERVEFPEAWSAPLVDDFRIFLEEVMYLCPWDAIPKGRRVPDDSLWSEKHSRSTLTFDLIEKKGKVFVWDHKGRPRAFVRRAETGPRRARVIDPSERMG